MMRLWERSDAPPHVDGAPDASGTHPYLVLCHRRAEETTSRAGEQASSEIDDGTATETDDFGDHGEHSDGSRHHTAVVYQWVRIPR